MREKGRLVDFEAPGKVCLANRANCKLNAVVIKPLLRRLAVTPKWRLPHLDPLQKELGLLSQKLGCGVSEHGVYAPSVEIKKLAGFVKRRVQRKEVTKECLGSSTSNCV